MIRRIGWGLFNVLVAVVTALVIAIGLPAFFTFVKGIHGTCVALLGDSSFCGVFPRGLEANDYAQLSTSLFSALIGAVVALIASYSTVFQYERQERLRTQNRRALAGLILGSEIGAFAEHLNSELHSAKLVGVVPKPHTVEINLTRVSVILPQQSTYEQLISEIALLGDTTSLAVARFYVQMRRAKADCEAGKMGFFPFAYMIQRTSEALLALEQVNKLTPEVVNAMNQVFDKVVGVAFQTTEFFDPADPIRVFSWTAREPDIAAWRELAKKRPVREGA